MKCYLDEHDASHTLEEERHSHGQSVDARVILNVGVESHAIAGYTLVPL